MSFPFGGATLLAGLLLALFAALLYTFGILRQRRGRPSEIELRPLPTVEALRSCLRRSAEMGEEVHLSPGAGALHERSSVAETLAGLEVVRGVAEEALALGVPVRVTTNDGLVSLPAQNALDWAWEAAGRPAGLDAESEFVAQQNPLAYAAGVMERLGRADLQGNVLVGSFGEELLLMGEVGARQTRFQVAGAVRPTAASLLPLVTDDFLLGEEIYAAGAYLDPKPVRTVGLLAQDGVRMVLILMIVFGVILATLGVLEGTLGALFQMPVP